MLYLYRFNTVWCSAITSLWSLKTVTHTPIVKRIWPESLSRCTHSLGHIFCKNTLDILEEINVNTGSLKEGKNHAFYVEYCIHTWVELFYRPSSYRLRWLWKKDVKIYSDRWWCKNESNFVSEQCEGAITLDFFSSSKAWNTLMKEFSISCFMSIKWQLDPKWKIKWK